jgi:membrane protein YqaA with SNARE-associated domain
MSDSAASPVPVHPPARRYAGPLGWLYRMKDWVEGMAQKRHAVTILFFLSLCESIFFPIPADVLLIALCVSLPARSFRFAAVCTAGSLVGAGIGYAIGYWLWYDLDGEFSGLAQFFFDHVPGFTVALFDAIQARYEEYAAAAVLTASFTPVPYKLVTVSAGVFQLSLAPFFFYSLLGRAGRFFLVAALFYFFGEPIKAFIDRYLGWLTLAFVVLLVGGFFALKYAF